MRRKNAVWATVAIVIATSFATARPDAQDKPAVKIPEPGVPQIMTLEGTFVRAAYNNEGYVIVGYKTANMSVGDEWMLLEMGATVRDGVPAYKLTRNAVSLETAGGATIPLASVPDYRGADLRALENRANVRNIGTLKGAELPRDQPLFDRGENRFDQRRLRQSCPLPVADQHLAERTGRRSPRSLWASGTDLMGESVFGSAWNSHMRDRFQTHSFQRAGLSTDIWARIPCSERWWSGASGWFRQGRRAAMKTTSRGIEPTCNSLQ